MTTTHQLMAAAFYLCGLLFLYHVDSVNSLRCKYCLPADCSSGNVTDIECLPNQICGIFRQFTPGGVGRDFTLRACASEPEELSCIQLPNSEKECVLYCATDNCNSATNLGEE